MAGYYRLKEVMASALTYTKSNLVDIAAKDYPRVAEFLVGASEQSACSASRLSAPADHYFLIFQCTRVSQSLNTSV